MDWETQKAKFFNHVATLTDLGPVKIVDFAAPGSGAYAIRYLFDEERFTLHVTGDLGTLTAVSRPDMTLKGCEAFCADPACFAEKVVCMDRSRWEYDKDAARADLGKIFSGREDGDGGNWVEFWEEFEWGFNPEKGMDWTVRKMAEEMLGDKGDPDLLLDVGKRENGCFAALMGALAMARRQIFGS